MMHNEKKLANIVEELTMFFFALGASDIHSSIQLQNHCGVILFDSDYSPECREKLDSLEKYFNEPKNEGLEDFYWELAGAGDPGESSQLLLVGMMVDRAEVNIEQERVKITLYKELEE